MRLNIKKGKLYTFVTGKHFRERLPHAPFYCISVLMERNRILIKVPNPKLVNTFPALSNPMLINKINPDSKANSNGLNLILFLIIKFKIGGVLADIWPIFTVPIHYWYLEHHPNLVNSNTNSILNSNQLWWPYYLTLKNKVPKPNHMICFLAECSRGPGGYFTLYPLTSLL